MPRTGDVLVVGAGPVGLLAALGLLRQGLAVTVIDAAASVVCSPRASIYSPVTIRLFDELAILDQVRAEAIRVEHNFFCDRVTGTKWGWTSRVLEPDTPFPYYLHLGQDELAQILVRTIQALPQADLRWSTRLEGLEQDRDGVTAIVRADGDSRDRLRFAWLIGADGARSEVRSALEIPFEGHSWPEHFVATNVHCDGLHGEHPAPYSGLYSHPERSNVIAPIGNDLWRITYNDDVETPPHELA